MLVGSYTDDVMDTIIVTATAGAGMYDNDGDDVSDVKLN